MPASLDPMPPKLRFGVAALVILLVAVAVRFRGLDFIVPLTVEHDDHIVKQVDMIERGVEDPERDLNYGSYPHLVAWVAIALTDPPGYWEGLDPERPIEEHLDLARAPVRRVRIVVALLSLLALPATYLLSRRYVRPGWAVFATGLVATSLLAVHFGTQARPHGAAVGLSTFGLLGCILVRRRPTWGSYAIAGAACGLAFGTLQSGIALGLPFLAAHLLSMRGQGAAHHAKLLLPAAALVGSILVFYPFLLEPSTGRDASQFEIKSDKGWYIEQSGHRLYFKMFVGKGFGILARSIWSWEPALAIGVALGALAWIVSLRQRGGESADRGDHLVLLAYVVPYTLVCGLYERTYERFLLPLLPVLACLAAYGFQRAAGRAPGGRRLATTAVAVALLLFSTAVVGKLTVIRGAPTTEHLAARWLEENARLDERILVSRPMKLPLYKTVDSDLEDHTDVPRGANHPGFNWNAYQRDVLVRDRGTPQWELVHLPVGKGARLLGLMRDKPAEYLSRLRGDWCVAEVFAEGRNAPGFGIVRAAMRKRFGVVETFTPDRELGPLVPLGYQDEVNVRVPHFAWRVLRAERMGPVIEVFRLSPRPQSSNSPDSNR